MGGRDEDDRTRSRALPIPFVPGTRQGLHADKSLSSGGIAEHFTQGWHVNELGCQASTNSVIRTRHALHTVWGQTVVMY